MSYKTKQVSEYNFIVLNNIYRQSDSTATLLTVTSTCYSITRNAQSTGSTGNRYHDDAGNSLHLRYAHPISDPAKFR
jgi:hypothetical protein